VALIETALCFILRDRQHRGTYSVKCSDDSWIMNRINDVEGSGRGQPAVGPTVSVSVWSTEENIEKHGDSRLLVTVSHPTRPDTYRIQDRDIIAWTRLLAIFVVLYSLEIMTAYNGSRGITPLILNLSTGRRRLANFAIRRRNQVPINLDAVGPRGSLDVLEKRNILHLLGFKPRSVQLVAWSLYRRHTGSLLLLLLLLLLLA
jgi:hypothetical protein